MSERKNDMVVSFRKYARYGFHRLQLDTADMCSLIYGAVGDGEQGRKMMAVYETVKGMHVFGFADAERAVREVYFKYPERPLKKNEVSLRVRRFATDFYMDERTVYRHLRLAKCSYFSYLCNGKIL